MRTLASLAVLVILAGSALGHGGPYTVRYVGGTALDADGASVGGACAATPLRLTHVGGACGLPLHETGFRVDVVDDRHGAIAFFWKASTAQGGSCAEGSGFGSGAFEVEPRCVSLSVHVALGATTGIVVIGPA